MRPAVAHKGYTDLPDKPDMESVFLSTNPKVHVSPTQLAWSPFDIPTEKTTFVDGLKTVAGSGEPSLREGLATHVYTANASMKNQAFVNQDGEFLIMPQQGRVDVQTEFGWLYVQPGEFLVVQRGIRFSVNLPDGPSRGYILEIWGSNFELPDLGPLGGYGMANARDFLYPQASYDLEPVSNFEIITKLNGKFFKSTQDHTPYDVVAWHGNYVPYKYDMTKFVNIGSISVDHIDPSVFTIMTAKSRDPNAALADVMIFMPRWDVASHTYRPPYYHRNVASELMGLIYGDYGGRSDSFQPGSVSYETGMTPHGVAYPEFKAASENPPPTQQISLGSMAFMFESSRPFTITDYAWKSDKIHFHETGMWDDLVNNFTLHLEEVKKLTNGKHEHGVNH
ncbi:homogentisate 1,2-dioxygenase [Sugiyamaella lignohabitans]|uniref:homogentisate 1,2-dioxygenase n=1 Tax=Sugiyamaella lignohabitans TaxID=796027 RepID=A0A167C507_9ASCO|nr:homogentisate 1,2-dioxygenase [Sugiyamaella lignohabitans]ANB11224.1 homogentisate 1,2-dioxygenase [Sugiyamaella lignohabitans]